MKFEILTIFPEFFRGPLEHGIVRRAREAGLVELAIHDLRAFTEDRHRTVDDRPFGGGEGMVLKPEPIFRCLECLQLAPRAERRERRAAESVVLTSPQGELFRQPVVAGAHRTDLRALRRRGRAGERVCRRPGDFGG